MIKLYTYKIIIKLYAYKIIIKLYIKNYYKIIYI